MARDFGTVKSAFWTDPEKQGWPTVQKLVALYLLTGPHTTALGAFRLPVAYMAADLDLTPADAKEALTQLCAAGFIEYDPASQWLWVRKFLRHNRPANARTWAHVRRLADGLPCNLPFREQVLASVKAAVEGVNETEELLANKSDEVSVEQEPEPEPEQEQITQKASPSGASAPPPPPVPTIEALNAALWSEGLAVLTAANIPEKQARKLVGRWKSDHGPPAVLAALAAARGNASPDPIAYVEGYFRERRTDKRPDRITADFASAARRIVADGVRDGAGALAPPADADAA